MTEKVEKKEEGRSLARRLEIPVIPGGLMPRDYGELIEFAKMVASSGMVPKSYNGNPGAVMVAVQMGAELGLTPMTSIRSIAVINGRPCLWGDAMLGLVVSNPQCQDVIETVEKGVATCTVKRKNRSPVTRTFSWDDAKRAGLDGKQGPWQQYPKRMLAMRARGFALRDAFPDVLSGVYSREEIDDIDMGAAEFVSGPTEPAIPEPEPEGVSSFGDDGIPPPAPEAEPKTGPEAPQDARGEAQGGESKPKPTQAKEKPDKGKYDDVGPASWGENGQAGF
jgi:hypothetical protein